MFQAHSLLWHYLWVAPNLLLGVLAWILGRRGFYPRFRAFIWYAWFQLAQWAVLYPIDLIRSIPAVDFWRVYWVSLALESGIVFVLISDIFNEVFGAYAALARLGKLLIRWAGALLIITATLFAAHAPTNNPYYWVIPACHILQEARYIVVSGLILLLFATAAYFRLSWDPRVFGIALGLGISACVHLADWAITANGGLAERRHLLDLANMASFHIAVLIWFYYLLVPQKAAAQSAAALPENNLAVWNRELERLLDQ